MIKRYLAKRENPWELLVLALACLLPGVALILQRKPVVLLNAGRGIIIWPTVLSPRGAHLIGCLMVVFGLLLIPLYFYALRYEEPEDDTPPQHFLDSP